MTGVLNFASNSGFALQEGGKLAWVHVDARLRRTYRSREDLEVMLSGGEDGLNNGAADAAGATSYSDGDHIAG